MNAYGSVDDAHLHMVEQVVVDCLATEQAGHKSHVQVAVAGQVAKVQLVEPVRDHCIGGR